MSTEPPVLVACGHGTRDPAGRQAVAALVAAVAGVLPELGVTEGERDAPSGVATERFAMHVAYGVILGLVADALNDRRVKVIRTEVRALHPD